MYGSLFLSLVKEKKIGFFFNRLKLSVFLFLGEIVSDDVSTQETREQHYRRKHMRQDKAANKTNGPSFDLVLIPRSVLLVLVPLFLVASQTKLHDRFSFLKCLKQITDPFLLILPIPMSTRLFIFSCPLGWMDSFASSSNSMFAGSGFAVFDLMSYAAGYISGNLNGGGSMHGVVAGVRGPFTQSQWMELEHQALIYKYITANVPIPSNLLMPIRKALDSVGFSTFSAGALRPNTCKYINKIRVLCPL